MERLNFYINKQIVYVNVERTNNKNMYLKVKNKEIVVSSPKNLKLEYIHSFVSEHIEKVFNYLEKVKQAELFSIEKKFVYLFGKKYIFKVLTGFKKESLVIKDNNVYIETKDGSDSEIDKAVKFYMKEALYKYIVSASPKFEEKLNVPKHQIRITYKITTWGTNMVDKKKISYSSRLAHYDHKVVDYLIVHELAHHFEPNHQEAFWKIVASVIPNYKNIGKILREDNALEEE